VLDHTASMNWHGSVTSTLPSLRFSLDRPEYLVFEQPLLIGGRIMEAFP
jgi:hypothetical protein